MVMFILYYMVAFSNICGSDVCSGDVLVKILYHATGRWTSARHPTSEVRASLRLAAAAVGSPPRLPPLLRHDVSITSRRDVTVL